MARNIIKLEWHKFIPKWDGNHLDDNPIELEIHPLSQQELTQYGRIGEVLKKKNPDVYALELSKRCFAKMLDM